MGSGPEPLSGESLMALVWDSPNRGVCVCVCVCVCMFEVVVVRRSRGGGRVVGIYLTHHCGFS